MPISKKENMGNKVFLCTEQKYKNISIASENHESISPE